jgi:hypothetical protein
MGSQHESMLVHFDQEILRYGQLRKLFVGLGSAFIAGHFIYNFLFRNVEKT